MLNSQPRGVYSWDPWCSQAPLETHVFCRLGISCVNRACTRSHIRIHPFPWISTYTNPCKGILNGICGSIDQLSPSLLYQWTSKLQLLNRPRRISLDRLHIYHQQYHYTLSGFLWISHEDHKYIQYHPRVLFSNLSKLRA